MTSQPGKQAIAIHILHNISSNHHGAEISVVERSAIKLLILMGYWGKTNFDVQKNFNVTLQIYNVVW